MSKYDVIVVGAGPAGIFACYELTRKAPHWKVLLVDKGHDIYRRRCPILEEKITLCPPAAGRKEFAGCLPACSITAGFGGAGAYSDGKFNITTEFGGWLSDYIAPSKVLDLIQYVDSINLEHGATTAVTDPMTDAVREIEQRGYAAGLKLLRAQVRHLGTEQNLEILKSIYEYLNTRIDMLFKAEVEDLVTEKIDGSHQVRGITLKNGETYEADLVMVAPGRDGSAWLTDILKKRRLKMTNNQVDVGVRVETSDVVMREINEHLYEGKFIYNTSVGTRVRTFAAILPDMSWSKTTAASWRPTAIPSRIRRWVREIPTSRCSFRIGLPNRSINPTNTRGKFASGPMICRTAGSSCKNTAIFCADVAPRPLAFPKASLNPR
ncbi:hypothetical protein HMSSN139_53910 [Paenibacillus sp. HMSSN-139]|nr:hypothetical protein HMSSN139_53910 [Paenibacillus sp. HMSSN-139]